MNVIKYANEWRINLNSIDAVKEFVELSKDVPFDIDLQLIDRPRSIDAKSIMGIFSLDLSQPHKLCINATGTAVDEYKEKISKFLC